MLRPLNDWVFVTLDPLPDENKVGSIFVPASGAERVRTGTVISAGPGMLHESGARRPVDVAPGEKIAFFRENLETRQGVQQQELLDRLYEVAGEYGLVRATSILYKLVS